LGAEISSYEQAKGRSNTVKTGDFLTRWATINFSRRTFVSYKEHMYVINKIPKQVNVHLNESIPCLYS
jgi:hypothetical protein